MPDTLEKNWSMGRCLTGKESGQGFEKNWSLCLLKKGFGLFWSQNINGVPCALGQNNNGSALCSWVEVEVEQEAPKDMQSHLPSSQFLCSVLLFFHLSKCILV